VIAEGVLQKVQKCEVDKQQKMLLSLRSNPQTGKPYVHELDSLCTWTEHYMSTVYYSTYGSPFVTRIVIT